MQRYFYRAQVRTECAGEAAHILRESMPSLPTVSAYQYNGNLFLYYECRDWASPRDIFPALSVFLEKWPGESRMRSWVPMLPVYQASSPREGVPWRDGTQPRQRRGMLLRLKPEMVSSYVFYHYQLQEEARHADNKYLAIALHENLLFYYDELPPVADSYEGLLRTHNSPADWDAVMEPHFLYWQDVEPMYKRKRPMECLLSR